MIKMLRARVKILREEAKWTFVKFENGELAFVPKEYIQ